MNIIFEDNIYAKFHAKAAISGTLRWILTLYYTLQRLLCYNSYAVERFPSLFRRVRPLFEESPFDLANFSGKVRLFPLPNLVLYPHVMQPMHLFEPRYKALLEEALESDGLIAISLLKTGWESDYEGRPPLESAATLCRILTYHKTNQETYNILLVGVRRLRILEELPPDKLFREARVEVLEDQYPTTLAERRPALQQQLMSAFRQILPKLAEPSEQLDQLLGQQISLGMLTDIISYTLDLGLTLKQQLLCEPVVDRRAELLCEFFEHQAKHPTEQSDKPFPPRFSNN
jgi:uncharacterized protein